MKYKIIYGTPKNPSDNYFDERKLGEGMTDFTNDECLNFAKYNYGDRYNKFRVVIVEKPNRNQKNTPLV